MFNTGDGRSDKSRFLAELLKAQRQQFLIDPHGPALDKWVRNLPRFCIEYELPLSDLNWRDWRRAKRGPQRILRDASTSDVSRGCSMANRIKIGSTTSGKSTAEAADIVGEFLKAEAEGERWAGVICDPHLRSLGWSVFRQLVALGMEERLIFDRLSYLKRVPGYRFLTPSRAKDELGAEWRTMNGPMRFGT